MVRVALRRQLGHCRSSSLTYLLTAVSMSCLLILKTHRGIFAGCISAIVLSTIAALVACAVCALPYSLDFGRTWVAAPIGVVVYGGVVYLCVRKAGLVKV